MNMDQLMTFFSYDFIQKAFFVGMVLALVGALLGVFVLLRRVSFFSDAMAHASLLGVALGLLIVVNTTMTAIIVSIVVGLLVAILSKRQNLASDTIIGVVFSASVALAIFIISLLPGVSIDLTSLLFGNILTVTTLDIWLAIIALVFTLVFVKFFTKPMLKMIFNRDLARVEQKGVTVIDYVFLSLLAFVIAVSLKLIGAILVSALVIIPAATSQNISSNLRQMFLFSIIIGILSVGSGLFLSFIFDSPSGSTIVLSASIFFIISLLMKK